MFPVPGYLSDPCFSPLMCAETVEHEDIYTEKIVTLGNKKEKPDKDSGLVEVVNYITYDENDLMRIENYRLKEVK